MRRRLGLVALAVAGLIVVAFSFPLGMLVGELARDRALTGAERDAQIIAVLVTATSGDADAIRGIVGQGELSDNELSVILADGTVIGDSLRTGERPDSVFESGTAGRLRLDGGEAVYLPTFTAGEIAVVRVFVENAELTSGVRRAWVILAALGLALTAISTLIASGLARNIVRPVEDLSQAAGRLGAGDLNTRVTPAGPPEIQEVGAEFNRLAEQISRLLESEREMAADLSHRLRTPLAAIGLDAERLPPGPDRERLLDDVAELQRSIDFVIGEMRRPERAEAVEHTSVAAVLTERMAFWDALAEDQGRAAGIAVADDLPDVAVARADLEATIDALLGNVFAHTAEGTRYAVSAECVGGVVRVAVDDAGEGFDAATVERGKSGGGSTGLGLDIARRTAEATGGSLTVGASPLGGARVTLAFAAAEPSGGPADA